MSKPPSTSPEGRRQRRLRTAELSAEQRAAVDARRLDRQTSEYHYARAFGRRIAWTLEAFPETD
jgi:hypothetical protein